MQDPEAFDDNEADPDKRPEPSCSTVMAKCWTEMLYICLYIVITFLTLYLIMKSIDNGKPMTVFIEFGIALVVDQIKSVPLQFIIWFIVVRRCGTFDIKDFVEWDDDEINLDEHMPSLWLSLRQQVFDFIEHPFIQDFILSMTIILCFVILAELALVPKDGTILSEIFWYINLILLIFFIVEIVMQFFSKGLEFLKSCISVFDSFIVIISFTFQVA